LSRPGEVEAITANESTVLDWIAELDQED